MTCIRQKNKKNCHHCWQKLKTKDRTGEHLQSSEGTKTEKQHFVSAKSKNWTKNWPNLQIQNSQRPGPPWKKPQFAIVVNIAWITVLLIHCIDIVAILIGQSKEDCLRMTSTGPDVLEMPWAWIVCEIEVLGFSRLLQTVQSPIFACDHRSWSLSLTGSHLGILMRAKWLTSMKNRGLWTV